MLENINLDIVIAMGIVVALFAFVKYLVPYLKNRKIDYYSEVKLALMLFGYALRDDKIKEISDLALEVVVALEELAISPIEKHNEAVYELSKQISNRLNLEIDEEALDLIVQVAVSLLPPTN